MILLHLLSREKNTCMSSPWSYRFSPRLSKACLAAMATLLKKQKPQYASTIAWWPGGLKNKHEALITFPYLARVFFKGGYFYVTTNLKDFFLNTPTIAFILTKNSPKKFEYRYVCNNNPLNLEASYSTLQFWKLEQHKQPVITLLEQIHLWPEKKKKYQLTSVYWFNVS